jgi:very-short-patch-repair endonuclease/DNA polymerase III delta prime subunit
VLEESRTTEASDGTTSASPTSSAFPAGSTEQGLKEIRTRLLDLTGRNKLLNFRFPSASCLRFVDVDLDSAFNHIMDGDKPFVLAVPEPPHEKGVEKPTAVIYAKELGWRASYDLGDSAPIATGIPPEEVYDGCLPVLHYSEQLNTLSRKIHEAARTAIEESGANMLYLSFGFLEWFESDESDEPRFAPLVSIPVTLDRTPGKGKAFRCELEFSGEDFDTNLSLVEKMRRDMGLEIPLLAEDESPEQYFRKFADLLNVKKRWRIRRQITLSLLDFGKLLMFRDLDPKNWPSTVSILNHQLVRELFDGERVSEITRSEEFPIDDPALRPELPALICDADSSQHSALIDALRGKNLVIEGPPGTGKSQTISNLIAEALAKGKTILFVSDKLAALQVVRDRLDERGLGAFCLELHSHRTKKGALLQDVARRIDMDGSFSDPADLDHLLSIAESRKGRLIEYVSLIKEVVNPIQKSVFNILWAREAAFQALPFDARMLSKIAPPLFLEYTPTKLAEAQDWLAIYARTLTEILTVYEKLDRHPWQWIQRDLSYGDEQSCFAILPELVVAIDKADKISGSLRDIPNPASAPNAAGSNTRDVASDWTVERTKYVEELLRVLEGAPKDALDLRSTSLESKKAIQYLRETSEKARRLQSKRAELSAKFNLNVGSPEELTRHAAVVDQTPWFKRWYSSDYLAAVKSYKTMARDYKRSSRAAMSEAFISVASYHVQRLAFDKSTAHRKHIGPGFIGIDSKWDQLLKLADWYEIVFVAFPDGDPVVMGFRTELLTKNAEALYALQTDKSGDPAVMFGGCAKLGLLVKRLSEAANIFNHDDIAIGDAPMATILSVIQQINAGINHTLREIAAKFRSSQPDDNLVEQAIALLQVVGTGGLQAVELILSPEYEHYLAELRSRLADLQIIMRRIVQLAETLTSLSNGDLWRRRPADSLADWRAAAVESLNNRDALQAWSDFMRCRMEGEQYGIAYLTAIAEDGSIKPEHIAAGFTFTFYNTLAKNVLSGNPALWAFSGATQEEIRQQFARADKDVIVLQRKRTAARAANRRVPSGNRTGHIRDWTELCLLRHEIKKQKRHIPIRQLVRRAGVTLQALKPCFMMGPQSVAKYLAPGSMQFNLIVMDEASQIRPEDAIGALARGGQAVIVGDPMQLPPTSFFNRIAPADDDDGNGGGNVAADSESILDVASSVYASVRRLRWHYRSQHESLIAFSNQEFYGDLIVFPSAQRDSESMGVKYRFVPGAVYENSRNPKEAAAVVDAVLDHMKNCQNQSLGVVAMNFEQRELIEELLEIRLRDDPFAQSFRTDMTGTKALFVKNLENVQGDERDVIFISTTYGSDAAGNQFQRFGPVNSEAGHRRLNVLFTRAKLRTVIFTSLDDDKILASPESSRGLRAFKGYLRFARTGILDTTLTKSDQPINDFERSVRAVIEAKNYEVIPQVGVAGFFIDMAIKNPKKPGAFLLGIECDGTTYHSSRSARDRDRLREEILRSRGWTLHRIWSTDWFKNRNKEIDKLFKHIELMVVRTGDSAK